MTIWCVRGVHATVVPMSDDDRGRAWEGRILLLLVALIVAATVFGLFFLDPHTSVR